MLTLKHFVLQKEVLNLYRQVIRASRSIPDPSTRSETVAWFRSEIERDRHLTDISVIESKINAILRELRQVLRVS
ncbi:hypothetical protein PISMIDRAFT_91222 [Pisolithus microcarpus 441]|uniref:LYR motif-containing protein 2 n=1 Tax=Pisolithus microcarpus 441 TaxID=765257 RepID=A0A0D0A2B9_9AGAM|nr:hypothetical protein BKA83DRAFT_91222 [Pisolithus microcarpus]KIK28597.1 hypothetical protein PISMIDRAFT_91222 [Pisolithus microcarpus 441]